MTVKRKGKPCEKKKKHQEAEVRERTKCQKQCLALLCVWKWGREGEEKYLEPDKDEIIIAITIIIIKRDHKEDRDRSSRQLTKKKKEYPRESKKVGIERGRKKMQSKKMKRWSGAGKLSSPLAVLDTGPATRAASRRGLAGRFSTRVLLQRDKKIM